MNQTLRYDEIKFDEIVILEDNLKALDDSDTDYIVEVLILYHDEIKEKQNVFHFALKQETILMILLHT